MNIAQAAYLVAAGLTLAGVAAASMGLLAGLGEVPRPRGRSALSGPAGDAHPSSEVPH